MDATLGYLRESLSNHLEKHDVCQRIYKKLMVKQYKNEDEFVRDLDEEEISFLDSVLPDEINYAREEQDDKRAKQLNEVYELLI